tara:strand:+ start:1376 stop:2326 length:951 start_codon:yes stop_codon:yes gene_type:complete
MKNNFFEVLRAGINSTFQDKGRENFYHIGLPFSGAMDNRNFVISNALVNNEYNQGVIEFAYQGPLFEFNGENISFSITGDVKFKIIKKDNTIINGECYKSYILNHKDKLDIISTNKSVYGYLAVSGGFSLDKILNSYSTFTRANVGPFDGKKLFLKQKILINKINQQLQIKQVKYLNSKIEYIRILKGTNYDYFSKEGIDNFLKKEFVVTKLTDRMGMRIEGPKIENIKEKNIRSEGLVKGAIQIPPDGNPIIMLSDHGTIGGYPKIGVVISADYDKLVQLVPNSKIKFKLIDLHEAEKLYKLYSLETENLLNQVK